MKGVPGPRAGVDAPGYSTTRLLACLTNVVAAWCVCYYR